RDRRRHAARRAARRTAELRPAARRAQHRAAAHRAATGVRHGGARRSSRAATALRARRVHPARRPLVAGHARRRPLRADPGAAGFPHRARAAGSARRPRAPVTSSLHPTVRTLRTTPTLVALVLAVACTAKTDKGPAIATQPVQKRDIVIDAQATGVVEPINIVEVKSKASGQIVKMPVETGALVKPGDLLVPIEPRDTQNQYDQSAAALAAARSKLEVSTAQKQRADELFKGRIITATEHEAAQLDFA